MMRKNSSPTWMKYKKGPVKNKALVHLSGVLESKCS